MIKNLLVIGDSWTAGDGLGDSHEERINNAWGTHLASTLNLSLYNVVMQGGSNKGIVDTLYTQEYNTTSYGEDTLVIFMLSTPWRFSFFQGDCQVTMGVNQPPHNNTADLVNFHKAYIAYAHSEKGLLHETHLAILRFQEYCKTRNFKYFICSGFHDYTKDLIASSLINTNLYMHTHTEYRSMLEFLHRTQEPDYRGMCGYDTFKTFSDVSQEDGHPNLNGHKLIADELYKFILHNRKLFL